MGFLINLVIGIGVAFLVAIILTFVATLVSAVLKVFRIRMIMFLILGIINSIIMLKFSKISLIFLVLVIVFFVMILNKRNEIYSKAKQPNMKLKPQFDEATSAEWSGFYVFVLFCPEIWIFGNSLEFVGIFKYVPICLSVIILLFAIVGIMEYGKDVLIDVEKVKEEENKRRNLINPDSLDDVFNIEKSSEKSTEDFINDTTVNNFQPIAFSDEKNNQSNGKAEDILNNIFNELDKC